MVHYFLLFFKISLNLLILLSILPLSVTVNSKLSLWATHALSTVYLGSGLRGSRLSKVLQMSLSSTNAFLFLLGNPEAYWGQMRYVVAPACSGSTPGAPTNGTCFESLPWTAPKQHLDQMLKPPDLTPLDVKLAPHHSSHTAADAALSHSTTSCSVSPSLKNKTQKYSVSSLEELFHFSLFTFTGLSFPAPWHIPSKGCQVL